MICPMRCDARHCKTMWEWRMEWEMALYLQSRLAMFRYTYVVYIWIDSKPLYEMICIHSYGVEFTAFTFSFACIRLDSNWSIFVQFALFVNENRGTHRHNRSRLAALIKPIHSQSSNVFISAIRFPGFNSHAHSVRLFADSSFTPSSVIYWKF